jgi:hypothetical protein
MTEQYRTICIHDKYLDRILRGEEKPLHTILHEVAHLRMRSGHDHAGHRFQESLERLERDYLLNEAN